MTNEIKKGKEGERLAAALLEEKGFTILEQNYRFGRSEIDLIACRDKWLVFVEVKTRSDVVFGYPEEFVETRQMENIMKGAEHYLFESNWHGFVRYDIISVSFILGKPEIVHFEDAFH